MSLPRTREIQQQPEKVHFRDIRPRFTVEKPGFKLTLKGRADAKPA